MSSIFKNELLCDNMHYYGSLYLDRIVCMAPCFRSTFEIDIQDVLIRSNKCDLSEFVAILIRSNKFQIV
jgi:hypothetical protein